MLERSDWYDIARDTNWTPSYVAREELFPPEMGDPYDIPLAEWETLRRALQGLPTANM